MVTTSLVQTMFSFQVVPLTISRSSLLLVMSGTSLVPYLTPSLPLPLFHAQRRLSGGHGIGPGPALPT